MIEDFIKNEKEYKIEIGDVSVTVIVHNYRTSQLDVTQFFTALDWLKQVHHHSTYEIFWIGDGALSVVTEKEGKKFKNSIVIIPPACRHYTINNGGRLGTMFFQIEKKQMTSPDTPQIYDKIAEIIGSELFVTDISPEEIFYVSNITNEKDAVISMDDDTFHLVFLLFSKLFRRIVPAPQSGKQDKYKTYINTIEDYIHDKYTEQIRITDIADSLNLSSKQVARIINNAYGCSLSELVNRHRITVASMLLTHTDLKIEDISASVGYEYPHRLFQNFKKIYGITPAEYRRAAQKGS